MLKIVSERTSFSGQFWQVTFCVTSTLPYFVREELLHDNCACEHAFPENVVDPARIWLLFGAVSKDKETKNNNIRNKARDKHVLT